MKDLITLEQAKPEVQRKFMAGVYWRMTLALFLTAAVAWYASQSDQIMGFLYSNRGLPFYGLIVAELVLVIALSAFIHKMNSFAALFFFVLYSVINGLTFSSIFIVYQIGSVFHVFLTSALMFAAMSVYGMFTKSDLTSAGRYLMMALIGILIAGLVNMFLRSSALGWLTSLLGVGIFIGLTAYDTQRLMRIGVKNDGSEKFQKMAVIGALELYLDFINIFIKMLALFGKRK
ncbi:MAG: Bax inhibitor-1/YccA family protein [Treponema sp.]|nr:Bax inhibitor-1/YccA family protein [Treponema sp.]